MGGRARGDALSLVCRGHGTVMARILGWRVRGCNGTSAAGPDGSAARRAIGQRAMAMAMAGASPDTTPGPPRPAQGPAPPRAQSAEAAQTAPHGTAVGRPRTHSHTPRPHGPARARQTQDHPNREACYQLGLGECPRFIQSLHAFYLLMIARSRTFDIEIMCSTQPQATTGAVTSRASSRAVQVDALRASLASARPCRAH